MNFVLSDRKLVTLAVNFKGLFFQSVSVVAVIIGFTNFEFCLCSTETNTRNVVKVAVIGVNNLRTGSSIHNE